MEILNSTVAIIVALISLVGLIFTMIKSRADAKSREKEISDLKSELETIKGEVGNFTKSTLKSLEESIERARAEMHETSREYHRMVAEMMRYNSRYNEQLIEVEEAKKTSLDNVHNELSEIKKALTKTEV